ncbi:hypothetical protein DFH09DRAFT_1077523 [Mycena vulgaris]|nr:hypothetical protein DFH09DRAFT_1077523 [Mycena vulgaris]
MIHERGRRILGNDNGGEAAREDQKTTGEWDHKGNDSQSFIPGRPQCIVLQRSGREAYLSGLFGMLRIAGGPWGLPVYVDLPNSFKFDSMQSPGGPRSTVNCGRSAKCAYQYGMSKIRIKAVKTRDLPVLADGLDQPS